MFDTVLVPLTLHEKQEEISKLFAVLVRMNVRSVILFHVKGDRSREKVERSLRQYGESAVPDGLEYTAETHPGPVSGTIVDAALNDKADGIAIPFARKGWLQRALLGSVTKDVIRSSPLPVFVHKPWPNRDEVPPTFRVLYATSLSPSDASIISFLQSANVVPDEVVLLHVGRRAPDPTAEAGRHNDVVAGLNGLSMRTGLPGDNVTIESVIGRPKRQIVRRSRLLEADLVVIGKSDTTAGLEQVLGSTAEEVSYNAWSSVLVVPTQSEASP